MLKHGQTHGGKGASYRRVNIEAYNKNLDAVDWGKSKSKPEAKEAPKKSRKEVPLTWLV